MDVMNFGVLVANGFRKVILGNKTFYARSTDDPVYQFSNRQCHVVTDYTLVQEVELRL